MPSCSTGTARKACAAAGIEMEDIADVLGDHAATVLWGAAFEDLLATDLPDGRNIADDYLRRRGWKESASTRDYIAGLRRSVISLYEVSGLVPGRSMQLRDLVRGGEPVRVSEKRGSEGLRQWDRIATRVIPLRDGPGEYLAGRTRGETEGGAAPGEGPDPHHHDGGRIAGARHAGAQGPSLVAGGELGRSRGARAGAARLGR